MHPSYGEVEYSDIAPILNQLEDSIMCLLKAGRCYINIILFAFLLSTHMTYADSKLLAHWPLLNDAKDISGNQHHGNDHAITFDSQRGALFNGRDSWIEISHTNSLSLGDGDFTIAMWVHTDSVLDDTLGDLFTKYDPEKRSGINLGIMNYHGVVCGQSNYRNVFFGLDDGQNPSGWVDRGRPGNTVYPMSLCVFDGDLYASTFEHGKDEAGHVYRYVNGTTWEDCGSPYPSNAVSALAVHNGELYAAASHYRSRGSALGDSENTLHGGRVFRYKGNQTWEDCGKLGDIEAIYGLASFNGQLYASSLYNPAGLFVYEGDQQWKDLGNPGGRIEALGVHNGHLYGTGFDLNYSGVFRYDDPNWTSYGTPPDTTQTYSFMQYQGGLFVGSWPTGKVFELRTPNDWHDRGQLGDERESMGMAVYNGKLYGGTLPLAQVYRYEDNNTWTNTGQLDTTPDVKYRRAWSMAVFDGKLFCGVLPSGKIYSYESGRCISHDYELPAGWAHITAQRKGADMKLFINGHMVNKKASADIKFNNSESIKIGLGQHDFFNGHIKDLRIYSTAIGQRKIKNLSQKP